MPRRARRLLLVLGGLALAATALAQVPGAPPPAAGLWPAGYPSPPVPRGMLPGDLPDPWMMPGVIRDVMRAKPKMPGYYEGDDFIAGARPDSPVAAMQGTREHGPADIQLEMGQRVKLLTDPGVSPSLRAETAAELIRAGDLEAALWLAARIGAPHPVEVPPGLPSARTAPWHLRRASPREITAGRLAELVLMEMLAPPTRSAYERRLPGGDGQLFRVRKWSAFLEARRDRALTAIRDEVGVAIDRYWQSGGHAVELP
ncbi:MAG: hypothetical protein HY904_14230 [Deltaproteobacteria bacterium]|nr:hypothetical protein [Deltaproteobacteria bacterium]